MLMLCRPYEKAIYALHKWQFDSQSIFSAGICIAYGLIQPAWLSQNQQPIPPSGENDKIAFEKF